MRSFVAGVEEDPPFKKWLWSSSACPGVLTLMGDPALPGGVFPFGCVAVAFSRVDRFADPRVPVAFLWVDRYAGPQVPKTAIT